MSEGTIAEVLAGTATWALVEADCQQVPWPVVDHVIADPPYSEATHGKSRAGASMPDGFQRERELGFEALVAGQREALAVRFVEVVRRWVLIFSDMESTGDWWRANVAAGLDHVRIGVWVKLGATPQFGGDRPANGCEPILVAHRKGRKRWNGGGSHAVWTHPIVTGSNAERTEHTTQKPVPLMLELVELFTDPGELVLDPFCGSGTTGVACLRLGRRFIGIECDPKYAEIARERLEAEERGLSLKAARAGQTTIFDVLGAAQGEG